MANNYKKELRKEIINFRRELNNSNHPSKGFIKLYVNGAEAALHDGLTSVAKENLLSAKTLFYVNGGKANIKLDNVADNGAWIMSLN